jgi:hypothetical protein
MDERPDEDFTALEFTGSLQECGFLFPSRFPAAEKKRDILSRYVSTLDAAVSAGAAAAMDMEEGLTASATPATAKGQKKKAAAAKSKPAAPVGVQKCAHPPPPPRTLCSVVLF